MKRCRRRLLQKTGEDFINDDALRQGVVKEKRKEEKEK